MKIETKIKIINKNGNEIELDYSEGLELFNCLKNIFGEEKGRLVIGSITHPYPDYTLPFTPYKWEITCSNMENK